MDQKQPNPVMVLMNRPEVQEKFKTLLGKRATSFVTSVLQIIASNELLKNADPNSVYQAAAVAATLDLPLNNNLGFAYIVPYQDRSGKVIAQFQMGYKGFIQLAQRSGQFKSIYAAPIYEGQIISENPLDGFEFDFTKKTSDKVLGYASKFKLLNGFEAVWYMTVDKIEKHAKKYSKTYSSAKDHVRAKSLWSTDFDGMAQKTVIKLLLSKFAPLSVEMQKAIITDQAIINNEETNDVRYLDNKDELEIDKEEERFKLLIEDAQSTNDLMSFKDNLPESLVPVYEEKLAKLMDNELN